MMSPKSTKKLKKPGSPLVVALIITPIAVVTALSLEWLITRKPTVSTIYITIPAAFVLSYLLTKILLRYQNLLDEKNKMLEITTRDLRHANHVMAAQNADLDAFAHTVAHELKTPLGVILGHSHLLKKEEFIKEPERIQEVAQQITATSLKMNSIIQEMLLLSNVRQSEEIQTHPLNMDEIVTEALRRLDNLILEHAAKIKKTKEWPTAHGYAPWIEEVWSNYISNALKYGGSAPEIELGAETQSDGKIRFWVRDSGPGITEEEQQQLFNNFTRLSAANAAGHGLGLSISQRIIEKLGGEVGVESLPDNGSTFYFTLPQAN